ncbi:cardioacceleratory peptide receptor-like isoform X2 [Schistocerca gregaria]|uniref:cardioacceleratory peptide receptor-like isoform X2 n=1 Tax=Schistocerca gregaria TaxID=7010 RepID=UPI00211EC90F|nr:cardioacceleratory peptide receptor-like isoform X2 [Schistocerca gregaria]
MTLSRWRKTEQLTVLWILFALIVLGNSAVLIALYLNKNRKSRMNFFIMQLALADLTVGLINVLTDIVTRITIVWYAGNVACKIVRFLQAVVTYSSTYMLVALSIDRYDAITHPMNFSGSWRRARALVVTAWGLSFLFSIPSMIFFEEQPIQGHAQCWIDFPHNWQWQVYMTLVAVALFIVPTVIISACYAVIVFTIWSKSKLLAPSVRPSRYSASRGNSRAGSGVSRGPAPSFSDDQDCRRASSRGLIPRAKIKTVKMTFVIVFVFVLCWSPYFVFDLLQVFGHVPRTQTMVALATFIQSLAPLNSAANPVIYCVFSTQICRTLRKLPPLRWLSVCFPRQAGRDGRRIRYDTTSTVTETLTQPSSRRRTSASVVFRPHDATVSVRLLPASGRRFSNYGNSAASATSVATSAV